MKRPKDNAPTDPTRVAQSKPDDSMRFELCDIIYNDYKGSTFFLNQMLEQKKIVLAKVLAFSKRNRKALERVRGNFEFWYPRADMAPETPESMSSSYYKNNKGDVVNAFCDDDLRDDYFLDPLKMQFLLSCNDISKMDTESENARRIADTNNETFLALAQAVGDVPCPGGFSTFEVMTRHISKMKERRALALADPRHSKDFRDLLVRSFDALLCHVDLLDGQFSAAQAIALGSIPHACAKIRPAPGV